LGFAQIAAVVQQTVLANELGYVVASDNAARQLSALDRAVRASIVPQLEGLPNTKLREFTDWWAGQPKLSKLTGSLDATRALISGLDLFIANAE
jgi:hypothetical protein